MLHVLTSLCCLYSAFNCENFEYWMLPYSFFSLNCHSTAMMNGITSTKARFLQIIFNAAWCGCPSRSFQTPVVDTWLLSSLCSAMLITIKQRKLWRNLKKALDRVCSIINLCVKCWIESVSQASSIYYLPCNHFELHCADISWACESN